MFVNLRMINLILENPLAQCTLFPFCGISNNRFGLTAIAWLYNKIVLHLIKDFFGLVLVAMKKIFAWLISCQKWFRSTSDNTTIMILFLSPWEGSSDNVTFFDQVVYVLLVIFIVFLISKSLLLIVDNLFLHVRAKKFHQKLRLLSIYYKYAFNFFSGMIFATLLILWGQTALPKQHVPVFVFIFLASCSNLLLLGYFYAIYSIYGIKNIKNQKDIESDLLERSNAFIISIIFLFIFSYFLFNALLLLSYTEGLYLMIDIFRSEIGPVDIEKFHSFLIYLFLHDVQAFLWLLIRFMTDIFIAIWMLLLFGNPVIILYYLNKYNDS